jgi:hypothetical protein
MKGGSGIFSNENWAQMTAIDQRSEPSTTDAQVGIFSLDLQEELHV